MVFAQPVSRNRRVRQRGFSLIELLIVIAIILVILGIALPQMNKAQMQARELAAVRTIQTLNTAQTQYYSEFGRYATSLTELGPAASGGQEGPSSAGLIPAGLATGTSGGYTYTVAATPTGYAVTAVPTQMGGSGRKTFYGDASGVIHENLGPEPATAQSPEIGRAAK